MKKLLFSTVFVLFSIVTSYSQNKFFIGEKSYPCTPSFSFGNGPDIIIAKNGENGILAISVYSEMANVGFCIKNNLIIYLEDNSVITCIDNKSYDYVDNIATTIYYLNKNDLSKMMKSNIFKIRYSLGLKDGGFSTEDGNFSATNIDTTAGALSTVKVNVQEIIKNLFDN